MFYYFFYEWYKPLGVHLFSYISFRGVLAAVTAFFISLFICAAVIKFFRRNLIAEPVAKGDSLALDELSKSKKGTPTMGGAAILIAVIVSTALWAKIDNFYVFLGIYTCFCLGVLGFIDDYIKLTRKDIPGLSGKAKLIFQVGFGLTLGWLLWYYLKDLSVSVSPASEGIPPKPGTIISVPFFKDVYPNLGILYIPLVALVITASSNAVNLTDGLDGLAISCTIIVGIAFAIICYIVGEKTISSDFLRIPYIRGSSELSIFCAALVGSGLGFLWHNCYPADIFMGDTGSLALGGALGLVALVVKQEVVLFFVGGIFVIEALSVIIQVISYKTRGKRVFLCSPIHHHFQFKGWPETKVAMRFCIIAAMLALISMITLKLR